MIDLEIKAALKPQASKFVKEYIDLCNKYGAEVVVNCHGIHCVVFDNGIQFAFSTVYPEWDKVDTSERL